MNANNSIFYFSTVADNSQLYLSSKIKNLQHSPLSKNREPSYFEVHGETTPENSSKILNCEFR